MPSPNYFHTTDKRGKASCVLCHCVVDYRDPVMRHVRQHYFKFHPETEVWGRGGLRFDISKALKTRPTIQ